MFGFGKKPIALPPAEPVVKTCDTDLLTALDLILETPNTKDLVKNKYAVLLKVHEAVQKDTTELDDTGQHVMDKLIELHDHPTIEWIIHENRYDFKFPWSDIYYEHIIGDCKDSNIQPYMVQKFFHLMMAKKPDPSQSALKFFVSLAHRSPESVQSFMFDDMLGYYAGLKDETLSSVFFRENDRLLALRPDLLTKEHVDLLKTNPSDLNNFHFMGRIFKDRPDLIDHDTLSHYSKSAIEIVLKKDNESKSVFRNYHHNIVSFLESGILKNIPEETLHALQLPVAELNESYVDYTAIRQLNSKMELLGVYGEERKNLSEPRIILRNYVRANKNAEKFKL